jgi:hypothetical protein
MLDMSNTYAMFYFYFMFDMSKMFSVLDVFDMFLFYHYESKLKRMK